ncbi:helix-turn-helix domain-containing protein [Thiomicrorhabdus sp.]|uniref:helix-turn-helix domain-containing protein n=1 Tax=Thiomicrorhabdus sp. TaxID=2039724 RepID=UPI002AA809B1|nr:helix-turn-helix domain-containing protein [Thiomicrorhabdus sp.]
MTDTVEEGNEQLIELLQKAREQQNISIDEAAEKLNLSVKQLEKFEESDLDLTTLSTFERGYLRNYAFLLGVNIEKFEEQFPRGMSVGAELQSIQRDNFKTRKPIKIGRFFKFIFFVALIILVIWVLSTLGIDFSQSDLGKTLEKATEISLPEPNK